KIDKSQITIFNLKDNFDYDVQNLLKVFEKLAEYKSGNESKKNEPVEIQEEKQAFVIEKKQSRPKEEKSRIKIDTTGEEEIKSSDEIPEEELIEEEFTEESNGPSLTLIENTGTGLTEAEVFELSEINEDIENSISEDADESADPV